MKKKFTEIARVFHIIIIILKCSFFFIYTTKLHNSRAARLSISTFHFPSSLFYTFALCCFYYIYSNKKKNPTIKKMLYARAGTRIYENSIEIRIRPVQVGNAVCASEKENENVENCSRKETEEETFTLYFFHIERG
jgi:hypothetical protein